MMDIKEAARTVLAKGGRISRPKYMARPERYVEVRGMGAPREGERPEDVPLNQITACSYLNGQYRSLSFTVEDLTADDWVEVERWR